MKKNINTYLLLKNKIRSDEPVNYDSPCTKKNY